MGNNLHFDLACQQAWADGTEDVDIFFCLGRCQIEGCTHRWRCVGGHNPQYDSIFILATAASRRFFSKIIGVASEADLLSDRLSQAITGATTSIACTEVPESEHSVIFPKTVEIDLGLHNEPVSNYSDRVG